MRRYGAHNGLRDGLRYGARAISKVFRKCTGEECRVGVNERRRACEEDVGKFHDVALSKSRKENRGPRKKKA
jgi:hypothetical protein